MLTQMNLQSKRRFANRTRVQRISNVIFLQMLEKIAFLGKGNVAKVTLVWFLKAKISVLDV
jgi:hypothetical protein